MAAISDAAIGSLAAWSAAVVRWPAGPRWFHTLSISDVDPEPSAVERRRSVAARRWPLVWAELTAAASNTAAASSSAAARSLAEAARSLASAAASRSVPSPDFPAAKCLWVEVDEVPRSRMITPLDRRHVLSDSLSETQMTCARSTLPNPGLTGNGCLDDVAVSENLDNRGLGAPKRTAAPTPPSKLIHRVSHNAAHRALRMLWTRIVDSWLRDWLQLDSTRVDPTTQRVQRAARLRDS
jgi:hypothetical protein